MFYKIIYGFTPEDYISIKENEVEKAYYCFLEKKDALFSGGAIKGSMIQMIKPDYHKTMGWNRGYRLDEFDYSELSSKGLDKKMEHFLSEKKEKVQHLISSGQQSLIGKNVEVALPVEDKQISDAVKALGDSKRIT